MAGIPVYTSAMVPAFERVQVRFPRSKKVRIRKKWSKDPRNWRTIPYVRFMSMRKDKMDQLILTHRQTMDAWLKQFGVGGKVSLDTETNGLKQAAQETPEDVSVLPRQPAVDSLQREAA